MECERVESRKMEKDKTQNSKQQLNQFNFDENNCNNTPMKTFTNAANEQNDERTDEPLQSKSSL